MPIAINIDEGSDNNPLVANDTTHHKQNGISSYI